MPRNEYHIGIDIGGTSTKLGIISTDGMIQKKSAFDSNIFDEPKEYLYKLSKDMERLIGNDISLSEIIGIGIGAPTANYHTGRIEGPVNLNWQEPLDIKSYLEMIWGIEVFVTNDANLAALGEQYYGLGKKYHNLIVVTLGTGVGAGIIANGQLVHGVDDLAGEIGHMTLIPEGRVCTCGKKGCLEAYVSIRGLMQSYQEIKGTATELQPIEIFQAAEKGDQHAYEAIKVTGSYLGHALANVGTALAPECIVLAGGLSNMGDTLLAHVRTAMEQNILNNLKGKIKLSLSSIVGNDLSLLGASRLVATNLFETKKMINQQE